MAVFPTNCFICKSTWIGAGAICDDCNYRIKSGTSRPVPPPPICTFCAGAHDTVDCLAAALHFQAQQAAAAAQANYKAAGIRTSRKYTGATMARRSRTRSVYTNYTPPLKFCTKCKSNYIIESKAGSVCSNCHTVVHNPCRNCGLTNTKGVQCADGGLTTQFIECQDCLFIE